MVLADATSSELLGAVDGPFDVIVAGELIEHVLNVGGLITNAWSLLERGGLLVITSPNPWAITWTPTILLGRYGGNVDHVASFDPYGMAEIADRTGFEFSAWFGERSAVQGKRVLLQWAGRMVRRVCSESIADCETIIYTFRRPVED